MPAIQPIAGVGGGGAGTPGKSAYQSWLDQGNTGTEAQFIASLKGSPGVAGPRGTKRFTGSGAPGTVAGSVDGDEYLDTATGDLYSLSGATWTKTGNLKGPVGAAGKDATPPRGTGGTVGSLTTRTGGSAVRVNLSPTDTDDAFKVSRLALLDADNKPVVANGTARVTGLGLPLGDFYLVPPGTTGAYGNLMPAPSPVPDGWPTPGSVLLNKYRRFLSVGSTYDDGTERYLGLGELVAITSTADPPGGRLGVASLPYNTDLIAGGQVERVLKIAGSTPAVTKLMAEGDTGVPTEISASPVLKDIGGTQKRVAVYQATNGTYDLLTIPGTPSQAGGEYRWRFGTGSDWGNAYPSIFFGFTGGQGVAGAHYAVTVSSTRVGLRYYTTDAADAITETFLTDVLHNITRAAGSMYNLCVQVDEAAKKVYARFWLDGQPEPTTWLLNGISAANLVSGRFGWRIKNAPSLTSNFAWAPPGGTAYYA